MRIMDMPEFRDKSQVLTYDIAVSVCDAVDSMAENNYGAVLVTENGKLAGIFTERDLLRRVAASRLDLSTIKLSDVMSSDLKTARADDDVADCLRRMSQGRFRHMPVVNESGDILGMLSQGDFVALTLSDALYRASESAKAGIFGGKATPTYIVLAVMVYTLLLLALLSMFGI